MNLKQKIAAGIAITALAFQLGAATIRAEPEISCVPHSYRQGYEPRMMSTKPIEVSGIEEALLRYDEADTVNFAYKNFTCDEANLVLQYLDRLNNFGGIYVDQSYYDGHLEQYSEDERKELLEKLKSVPIEERMGYNRSYRLLNPISQIENGNLLDPVVFGAIGSMEEIKGKKGTKKVSLDDVINAIAGSELVFFGVDHNNKYAHDTIGKIVEKLAEKGYKINLFRECFFEGQQLFSQAEMPIVERVAKANKTGQKIWLINMPLHNKGDEDKFYHLVDRYDLYEMDTKMADCVARNYDDKKINILVNGMAHTIFDVRMPSKIHERIGNKKSARVIFAYQHAVDAHYDMKKKLIDGYFTPNNPLELTEEDVRKGYGIGDEVMHERVRQQIDFYSDNLKVYKIRDVMKGIKSGINGGIGDEKK